VSGFAGIVRLEPDPESVERDRETIAHMARAIAFRGPDALQQTLQPGASFAFSLLKTGPAPQEPSQPCTLHGETWFLGDVRCDGREELKQKLVQHGVELPASPSSEQLVLQYFAKFGEAGLPDLNGDLSFILWNARERKLVERRRIGRQSKDRLRSNPEFLLYSIGFCIATYLLTVIQARCLNLRPQVTGHIVAPAQ
jgi:asparagine synthetase B (glutamine-hydrolysing)